MSKSLQAAVCSSALTTRHLQGACSHCAFAGSDRRPARGFLLARHSALAVVFAVVCTEAPPLGALDRCLSFRKAGLRASRIVEGDKDERTNKQTNVTGVRGAPATPEGRGLICRMPWAVALSPRGAPGAGVSDLWASWTVHLPPNPVPALGVRPSH